MERHIKGARRRVGGVTERILVDGGRRGTGTGQRRERGAIAESIFANLANRVGEVYRGETLTVPERAITYNGVACGRSLFGVHGAHHTSLRCRGRTYGYVLKGHTIIERSLIDKRHAARNVDLDKHAVLMECALAYGLQALRQDHLLQFGTVGKLIRQKLFHSIAHSDLLQMTRTAERRIVMSHKTLIHHCSTKIVELTSHISLGDWRQRKHALSNGE